MAEARAWRASTDGLRLRLRVTPRSGRTRIEGVVALPDGAALKVAVAAPPEDGKANAAVLRVLAKALGVPRSALSLAAGAGARTKTVAIAGDAAALARTLEGIAAETCET